jgi:hypothetical protein
MAAETRTQPYPPSWAEAWPPDDTEESVLGTDLHQTTITNLRWGINEVARVGLSPEQPARWRAFSQMALLDCVRPDGSLYRTYPDIFVYSRPIAATRGSLSVNVDGPPELIIEVLSEATYLTDLHLARGKGYSYAQAGVAEYLTLDYTGQYIPEGIRAWRLVNGIYRPWEPEANGRWQSARFPFAIGIEDGWAGVFTPDGRRIVREGEVEAELARRDAEIERQDAEIERLRRLLDAQQGRQ